MLLGSILFLALYLFLGLASPSHELVALSLEFSCAALGTAIFLRELAKLILTDSDCVTHGFVAQQLRQFLAPTLRVRMTVLVLLLLLPVLASNMTGCLSIGAQSFCGFEKP